MYGGASITAVSGGSLSAGLFRPVNVPRVSKPSGLWVCRGSCGRARERGLELEVASELGRPQVVDGFVADGGPTCPCWRVLTRQGASCVGSRVLRPWRIFRFTERTLTE